MNIQIFHATAGHGHKKVAETIKQTFLKRGLEDSQVHLFDILDYVPKLSGLLYPAAYYYAVKLVPKLWGWSYEMLDRPAIYPLIHPLRRLHNGLLGISVLNKVRRENPDVIVNCHFFTAEHFAEAKRKGKIKATLITVITDFFPHRFWVNEGTDYYWVMGEEGKQDLLRRGVKESQIITGGIPISDAFKPTGKKLEILQKWGFSPNRTTLLFTSGSFGLGHQEQILKELAEFQDQIQCFVVCGNNKTLQHRLEAQSWSFPVKIFGFVDFMAELMEASDLMLAKTGGSTTTESLAKTLPMVILDPIPGQETRNAKLLLDRHASFTLAEPSQIITIMKSVFNSPDLLSDKHKEIRKMARPNAADDFVTFVLELLRKPNV